MLDSMNIYEKKLVYTTIKKKNKTPQKGMDI